MPIGERGANASVQVEGLARLRRQIRRLDPEIDKALRDELKAVGEVVAADARARVPVRSGRARASIKVSVNSKGVFIKGGTPKRVPYYGWLDFGGRLQSSRGRRNQQDRPKRKHGRYIYPAIYANRSRTVRAVERATDRAIKRAGLD